jgi:hypothetical protein
MADLKHLEKLIGNWEGSSKLWLSPDQPAKESHSTAKVTRVNEKRIRVDYTWTYEEAAQEGSILIDATEQPGAAAASLVDTFHTGNKPMQCRGRVGGMTALDVPFQDPAGGAFLATLL